MAASATVLQALHITLSSIHVSGASRAASSRSCAALRPPPLAHTLSQQPVRHGRSQRRPAAYQVVEAAQADKPRGRNPAVNLSGGGSSGGNPAWQPLVAALDRRQPEAAWKEFMRLLEQGILPPIAVCDRLIYALCGRRRFQEAWRAYAATTPAGYSLQYNTYQALITLALKAGDLDAAVDAFRDMQAGGRAANVVTYCGLISALGRERRRRGVRYAQTAHELWGELAGSGTQLDAAAFRTGLKACVDVGRLREAERLLQRMAAAGAPPDVRAYNILLAGHGRAGATGAMARLMQRMAAGGVQPSAVTYNTLVDGYVRARDLAGARGAAERAATAGVALDVWTYSTLIKGYVQAGQLAAAETVLGDMAAAGVQPSCVTYTTLVDGHVRAGDMQAARRLVQAMRAAGQAPNALTYNTLLRGYAAQAASASAAAAGDGGGGAAAPGSVPPAGEPAALAAALALLRDMQGQGVAPTADTFNTLMAAAVAAGQFQLALDLAGRLAAAGLRPDGLTYTTLIHAHGRLGQASAAAAAFEALLRDRSAAADLRAYNALVDALARNADMPAAERMLASAAELASKQGGWVREGRRAEGRGQRG
ncbi:hypothetical protein CHLNCDRAFT_34493 [Chlorella variabilis]|uniref:Pentacotripeptide-repeat region of PRORP domain-containing protein n=1 Tax=Chlorella variabilis TaxID=554065 RepID=E1Z8G4_CHLVA|nr:hypothetical protein CHLNCDRAFT_34493 [Chlorella variabilis]EFN58087.1 hypothetical protein CHLNCDRAFT_34493 [Chlorella variabilis]|eukprot:XP_005850189.1 hypothetical protein CHLNCDRAFT_34493 [Chlorella variabilis]